MINLVYGSELNIEIPEYLKGQLAEIFDQDIRISAGLSLEAAEWNPKRLQYYADSILDILPFPEPGVHTLAVLEADIFAFGLNFIFGEADTLTRKALISLKRLKPEYHHQFPDETLFLDRTLKEAVHELGHTYGLRHCPNIRCVMHFSNGIENTDIKGHRFCPTCRRALEKQMRTENVIFLRRLVNIKKP